MILYEVSVEVQVELSAVFEEYMRQKHIPEIWATGCFQTIRFDKASDGLFRTSYQAKTQADYERYLSEHATAMRADFMQHFPTGCVPSRQVYTDVQVWS
jgi:hypothetical protein